MEQERIWIYSSRAIEEVEPLISVIVPCYNYSQFVVQAVESAFGQTGNDFEVIVINDGSTDDSAAVIKELLSRFDNRPMRFVDRPNSGEPAIARNTGIEIARGKYILPLDSDDYFADGAFDSYRKAIDSYQNDEVVIYGRLQCFGTENYVWMTKTFHPAQQLRRNHLVASSLFSKSLWERVGGYPLEVPGYEDFGFWTACAIAGAHFINIPVITYWYRTTEAESMGKNGLRKHEQMMAKLYLRYPDIYEFEELAWAADYLERNPEPPETLELINGPSEEFPTATSLIIRLYSGHYSVEAKRKAVSFLDTYPPTFSRGLLDARPATLCPLDASDPKNIEEPVLPNLYKSKNVQSDPIEEAVNLAKRGMLRAARAKLKRLQGQSDWSDRAGHALRQLDNAGN